MVTFKEISEEIYAWVVVLGVLVGGVVWLVTMQLSIVQLRSQHDGIQTQLRFLDEHGTRVLADRVNRIDDRLNGVAVRNSEQDKTIADIQKQLRTLDTIYDRQIQAINQLNRLSEKLQVGAPIALPRNGDR